MKKNVLVCAFIIIAFSLISCSETVEKVLYLGGEKGTDVNSESKIINSEDGTNNTILNKVTELGFKIDPESQKVILFYYRPDKSYSDWGLWLWTEGGQGDESYLDTDGKFQKDADTGIAYMVLDSNLLIKATKVLNAINNNEYIYLIIRDKDWNKDTDNWGHEQCMDFSTGQKHFFVISEDSTVYSVPNKTIYSSLEITSLPKNLNYFTNGKLDLTGLVVKMNLTDGTQRTLSSSEYIVEPADGTELTEQGACPIKITAGGRTAYFNIYVGKTAFTSLRITNLPDKTWYDDTESFDTTGLEVTAVFNDGKDNQNIILEPWEYQINLKNGSALEAGSGQKVTVTYSGKSASFIINVGSTWESYEFVDDGTHILSDICMNNTKVRSVSIPDTITEIPEYAFYGCTALEAITIPTSIDIIGEKAFMDCISLKEINLCEKTGWDNGLIIGNEAFKNCESIKSLKFFGRKTCFRNKCFENCNNLEFVVFGNYLTCSKADDSGDSAPFIKCDNLTEVDFNNKIEYYDYWSDSYSRPYFAKCQNLKILKNLNKIPRLYYCPSVTELEIPTDVNFKTIPSHSFEGCTGITQIKIPNNIIRIDNHAFSSCTSLNDILLSQNITSIGDCVFENCTSITSIDLPLKLGTLPPKLFYKCTNLNQLNINKLCSKIEYNAFDTCSKLKILNYKGSKNEWNSIDIDYWAFNGSSVEKIICNDGEILIDQEE